MRPTSLTRPAAATATLLSLLGVALSVETPAEGEKWWLRDELREFAKPWTDEDTGHTIFPPRQQELWGIDKQGKIIDPAQFEVAVDAIRELPLATARTEVERAASAPENTPLIQDIPHKKECLEIDAAYLPFDMTGQMMTYVDSWRSCQERCASVAGCLHFTYSPMDKACHITDSTFQTRGAFGSLSGPAKCPGDEADEKISEYEVVGSDIISPPPRTGAQDTPSSLPSDDNDDDPGHLASPSRSPSSGAAVLASLVSFSSLSSLQQWTLAAGLLVFLAGLATSLGKWLRQQRRKSGKTPYSALDSTVREERAMCRLV